MTRHLQADIFYYLEGHIPIIDELEEIKRLPKMGSDKNTITSLSIFLTHAN